MTSASEAVLLWRPGPGRGRHHAAETHFAEETRVLASATLAMTADRTMMTAISVEAAVRHATNTTGTLAM